MFAASLYILCIFVELYYNAFPQTHTHTLLFSDLYGFVLVLPLSCNVHNLPGSLHLSLESHIVTAGRT